MDADTYAQAIQYEQLTQSVYKQILEREGDRSTEVAHNKNVRGRSGVEHQIDVLWRFKKAGVKHAVFIECKNYASALTLEKVRNFFAVLHDIGNCRGIMVTKTGYQSGVVEFANFYGIDLKLLRKPTDEDWEGRVKDIVINITAKQVASTLERPVVANFMMGAKDEEQVKRIAHLKESNRLTIGDPASLQFYNYKREPVEDVLGWWLPSQLAVIDKPAGGPYQQKIDLQDRWVLVNAGETDEELIPIIGIDAHYFVEEFDPREVVLHGEEIVEAILKDFDTGETEHVKRFD